MDDEVKVVTVDEAELTLMIFTYLIPGDEPPPDRPAREVLEMVGRAAEACPIPVVKERLETALAMAADLSHMALAWISAKTNAAHPGTMRKVAVHDAPETRQ